MKILFYINGIGGGGAERVITNLANGMAAKGHDIVLVTSFPREGEYTLSSGIKRYNLEEAPADRREFIRKNIRRTKKLRKICKKEACDIAVSFMEGPNFRLIFSTRFLNIKTIISLRSDPAKEYSNFIHKWIAEFVYSKADACVFQTEEAERFFRGRLKRNAIICNPVAEEFYKDTISTGKGSVVAVGRLEKTKNFELLIKSFSRIAEEFPEEKLLIYGEGSNYKALSQLIRYMHLEKRVFLQGKTDCLPGKLENAKLFVLSSDYEGMPNSLMEAMAMGIPVIATDCPCGGPEFLLESGRFGLLVPVKSEEGMAEAMRDLLRDAEQRNEFARKARIRAEEFRTGRVCDIWLDLFLSVILDKGLKR